MVKTAAELCAYHEIQLLPESRALLFPELTPRQYFDRLRAAGHYADARRVLAHALSRRRALWWGCLCAAEAYATHPGHRDWQALDAVANYVVAGSETGRRAIEKLSEEISIESPGGCLLMAAFFSGGNTSIPAQPFVPPKPFITGRLVGVAVYLVSVWNDPPHYLEHLRRYLDLGLELANGPEPWTSCPESADPRSLQQWLCARTHSLCRLEGSVTETEGWLSESVGGSA